MAEVAGVLLDHVHHDDTELDSSPARVAARDTEVRYLGDPAGSEVHLLPPCPPSVGNDVRVGDSPVPVSVTVLRSAVAPRRLLAGHHLPEPMPLDVGEMADQTEKRHR